MNASRQMMKKGERGGQAGRPTLRGHGDRVVVLGLILLSIAQAQTPSKLPDGESKALVEKVCAKCHELDGILRTRNTKERWSSIVDEMLSRGAEASDEEIEQIIDYLAKNFGRKVNVNKAAGAELAQALAVPKETAAAIVSYREKNGPYKNWDDLKKVPGIDLKQIEDKRDNIEFGEKESQK